MKAAWVAVVFVIAGGVGLLVIWSKRQRSIKALDARESLDDEVFYARYYADSKLPEALVVQLRHEVAETLKVPAAKLRPEHRFGEQIGTYWITSDDLDVLASKGQDRAKSLGLTADLQKFNTVDDYIRCFARPTITTNNEPYQDAVNW
jgi:hypothetical protein